MSTANYGHLVVAVLDDCYRRFGKPKDASELADQAAWVRCRVQDIRDGRPIDQPRHAPRRDDPARDDAWTDLGGQ
jgi:hypothetical protein